MPISGNPKMMAYDIAKGFTHLSQATLKKYNPADLKIILTNLSIVQREIRGEQIPQEDVMAIKAKNQRLQRLSQAVSVINSYAKLHRIRI